MNIAAFSGPSRSGLLSKVVLIVFFGISFSCGVKDLDKRGPGTDPITLKDCLKQSETVETTRCSSDAEMISLLEVDKVKACHDAGKLYDRNDAVCSAAYIDLYPCDIEGIVQAFSSTSLQIRDVLLQSIGDPSVRGDRGDGFLIDQCGQYPDGKPVVFLVRLMVEDGPRVLVRKLEPGAPIQTQSNDTADSQ